MKKTYITSIIWTCIGLSIFALAWYKMKPLFVVLGLSLVISIIIATVVQKVLKREEFEFASICGVLLLVILSFIGGCWFFINDGENYHVSGYGDKRHLFGDCEYKVNTEKDIEIGKFGAILFGNYTDCETCKQRREAENIKAHEIIEQKIAERMQKKHLSDIEDIKNKIEELEEVLSRLLDGEDIDASDYDFRIDIEDEIREEVESELESDKEDRYDDSRWEPTVY